MLPEREVAVFLFKKYGYSLAVSKKLLPLQPQSREIASLKSAELPRWRNW